jgi:hypothetical protein
VDVSCQIGTGGTVGVKFDNIVNSLSTNGKITTIYVQVSIKWSANAVVTHIVCAAVDA